MQENVIVVKRNKKIEGLFKNHILKNNFISLSVLWIALLPALIGCGTNATSENDTRPSKIANDVLPSGLNKNDLAKQFAGTWRYSTEKLLNNDGTTTSFDYLTKFSFRPTKMDHGTYEKIGGTDYMARGTWSFWDETENPDGTYDVKLTLASEVNNPDLDTM